MAEIASAWVSIIPSTRNFGARLTGSVTKDSEKAGKKAGASFGKVFALAAGVGIGAKLGGFLKGAITEASDLAETGTKINAIFGKDAGKAVQAFSKNSATALGQSRLSALDAAATFGVFGKAAGLTGKSLATFSTDFTGLASDLASFNNTTPEQAIEAIGAALRGESEPIRSYGVLLDDATLRQEALRLGLVKTTKEALTPQQKVLAAQAAIYKQTKDAQGDFAKTSGGLANQQRILSAQFTNLKATVGAALLPVVTRFFSALNKQGIPALKRIGPLFTKVADAVKPVFDRIGGFIRKNPTFVKAFVAALGGLVVAIGAVTLATTLFSVALNSTGIPLVILGIAALVAGLVVAYKRSAEFRNVVNAVGASLKDFGLFMKNDVLPVVRNVAEFIGRKARPVIKQLGETFKKDILPTLSKAVAKFREAQPTIQRVSAVVLRLVASGLKLNAAVLSKVLPPLIRFGGFLFRTLIPAGIQTAGMFVKVIQKLAEFGRAINDGLGKVTRFSKGVGEKIRTAISIINGLPGRAKNAIGDLGNTLYNAGRELIGGLISGITSKIGDLRDTVSGLASKVRGYFPGSPVKEGPLKSFNGGAAGRKLIEMVIKGLRQGEKPLEARMKRVTQIVADAVARQHDKIERANRQLNALVKARTEMMKSIGSDLRGEFSLSGLLSDSTNEFGFSDLTFNGIRNGVRAAQARIAIFSQKLYALRKRKFPATLIQEVASLGSADGTKVANVLLSGSRADQRALQADLRALNSASTNVGAQVARATYDRRIADVERDKRQALATERGMIAAARRMKIKVEVDPVSGRALARWYLDGKRLAEQLA